MLQVDGNSLKKISNGVFSGFNSLRTLFITLRSTAFYDGDDIRNLINGRTLTDVVHLKITDTFISFQVKSLLGYDHPNPTSFWPRLRKFECIHCQLLDGSISNLFSSSKIPIEEINLSYNNILNGANSLWVGAPDLQVIDLSHNKIISIADDITTLTNLRVINLSHNKISCRISDSCLSFMFNMPQLESVDIRNNAITRVDADYITSNMEDKRMRILLGGNPFDCSCRQGAPSTVKLFKNAVMDDHSVFSSHDIENDVKCHDPVALRGTRVIDVDFHGPPAWDPEKPHQVYYPTSCQPEASPITL